MGFWWAVGSGGVVGMVEDLHLGFVMVDIIIYVISWVSWKWYTYMVEEIHKC